MRSAQLIKMTVAFVTLLGAVVTCESETDSAQCPGPDYTPGPTYDFQLELSVVATGEDIGTRWYRVDVDEVLSADSTRPLIQGISVEPNGEYRYVFYPAPSPGARLDVLITLWDFAANCAVVGDNPVAAQLTEGEWVRVRFEVACVAI